MRKSMATLLGSGAAIAIGLVLMVLGTQAVLEDVEQGTGMLSAGSPLVVEVVMEPEETPVGVFVAQVMGADGDSGISATVIGPLGSELARAPVDTESVEGRFDVEISGAYRIVVESPVREELRAFAAIGPLPDVHSKALAFIPFYVLIAGIMGMGGLGVYWAVTLRRS